MENNVVELFPQADKPSTSGSEANPAEKARDRTRREADSLRGRLSGLLTQEEARFFARSLGRLIEQSGWRQTNKNFMATLGKRVKHPTFDKQRKRYIQFEDETSPAARGGGKLFLHIAEVLAVWDDPPDRALAINKLLADLGVGLPESSKNLSATKIDSVESAEAFVQLSHLLKMAVGRLSRELDLVSYFRFLLASNLEIRDGATFFKRETQYGFSINSIFDECQMFEADGLIPSFLPRVHIATLYRRHISTTVYVPQPTIPPEEKNSPDLLYLTGLRQLGLEPSPHAGGAFPSAPSGWEKFSPDGLSCVYERLDVWLVITPDGTAENIRPALIFAAGKSVSPDGDAWRSEEAFHEYVNSSVYCDSAGEGDDPNCAGGWPSSISSLVTKPSAAVFYPDGALHHHYGLSAPNMGNSGNASTLELRAQVAYLGHIDWPSIDAGSSLKFLDEKCKRILFQQCFFYNDHENDYHLATLFPSILNDTPILIRHFVDSEAWSPAPMKSLGGFLLRSLLEAEESSVLSGLRKSAASLRRAMDSFNKDGREEFERRYDAATSLTDQTVEERR